MKEKKEKDNSENERMEVTLRKTRKKERGNESQGKNKERRTALGTIIRKENQVSGRRGSE